jgi:uncharacterized membrane protein
VSSDSSYEFAPREEPPREAHQAPQLPIPDALPEKSCPHCGFRIVGRINRPRCPECSAPLDPAAADLLQFSNVGWTRSISWGPALVSAAVLLHVGGAVLAWIASTDTHDRLARVLNLAASLVALAGIWIVTRGEGGGAPQRRGALAMVARVAALGVCGLMVGVVMATFAKQAGFERAMMVGTLATMAVGTLCLCFFLSALAARIPNDSLAGQFQNLAWVLPGVLVVLIIARFVDVNLFLEYLFFCGFPMVGGLVGLVGWGAITLLRLTLDLRNAATAAEDIVAHRVKRAQQAEAIRLATHPPRPGGAVPGPMSGPEPAE